MRLLLHIQLRGGSVSDCSNATLATSCLQSSRGCHCPVALHLLQHVSLLCSIRAGDICSFLRFLQPLLRPLQPLLQVLRRRLCRLLRCCLRVGQLLLCCCHLAGRQVSHVS
jgi:hypothetical protein